MNHYQSLSASSICVHTCMYKYENLQKWINCEEGQEVLHLLCDFPFSKKSVYFDPDIMYSDDHVNEEQVKPILECITHMVEFINEVENIRCFSMCWHCHRLCTINFTIDNIPSFDVERRCCVDCEL